MSRALLLVPLVLVLWARPARGEAGTPPWGGLRRVVTLRDHNTRVVLLGVMALGAAGGVTGSFLLLRRRALVGDAISHATLPGIAAAYLVMAGLGGDGKWLPGLLAGAAATGLLGMGAVIAIGRVSRLKDDVALGIVLSVFFGAGVALLGVIQRMRTGSQAGLESFIYGKTASMLASDARLIAIAAMGVALACALLFKELRLVCFDREFAASQGWPVPVLDGLLMGLVVAVTVIGLQAVGLILVIAMLIIPPAAARFWTDRLGAMIAVSAAVGAASGLVGAAASALAPRLPAGAVIVLVSAGAFAISLAFGPARGVAARGLRRVRTRRRVERQHLLRAMWELRERHGLGEPARPTRTGELLEARSWSPARLGRVLRRAARDGLVRREAGDSWSLSEAGLAEAGRLVRNHRLWELFLIRHADIAPSHVDRDADQIEHVLGDEMVRSLEETVRDAGSAGSVPASPHRTRGGGGPT